MKGGPTYRVASFCFFFTLCKPLLYSANIPTINDLSNLAVLLFVYRETNNLVPGKFSSFLKPIGQIHCHYTLGSTKFNIPYARTSLRMANAQVLGLRLWNSLPYRVQKAKSIGSFKAQLKSILVSKYRNRRSYYFIY